MSETQIIEPSELLDTSRRFFISGAGKATLSATAVALLAGCQSMAAGTSNARTVNPEQDVAILNAALGLEHWLTDPQATIAGQKMYFRVAERSDRLDIIAYLKQESGSGQETGD